MRASWWSRVIPALTVAFVATLITPAAKAQEQEPEAKTEGAADRDDASARLEAQREAWGLVTPEFRKLELKEGTKHSTKKNASGPKWVSVGPTGSDYDQNGSFTGHVRDSGRARTILPHPTDPNIVYFLTSGGG